MTKISILYPNQKNAAFDMEYYLDKHMPMAIEFLSGEAGFRGVSVERGVTGAGPNTEPLYTAMCHFLFDSVESFTAAFGPHAAVLQGDMKNYTATEPVIQVSEVVISR